MQRATRTNLILLGIAGLLCAIVYWQIGKETARFEPPLSTLDQALVQRVAVSCRACIARRFELRDGHWLMLEPYALPADDAMVKRLIDIAASPVRSRRPLEEFDAAAIGLDPPLMSLQIDDQRFDVGMTDALLGDRYVRNGDVVAMVPDRFSPYLVAAAESELDRHLVPRGSVLKRVSIDSKELTDLPVEWSAVVAKGIRSANAVPSSQKATLVVLGFDDGTELIYQLDQGSDPPIAWRMQPALGFELDPAAVPALLGIADPLP